MARPDTTLETILTRIVARLQDQLSVGDGVCYVSDEPDSSPPTPGDFWYVVSPGTNIQFDDRAFDGGGNNQLTVRMIVIVTIHSSAQNDEVGHASNWFSHSTRGVFSKSRLVLAALSQHDLDDGAGNQILNQPMMPNEMTATRNLRENGSLQIGFHIEFDMSLA